MVEENKSIGSNRAVDPGGATRTIPERFARRVSVAVVMIGRTPMRVILAGPRVFDRNTTDGSYILAVGVGW